jgi:ATP-dependent DNA helicase RecG
VNSRPTGADPRVEAAGSPARTLRSLHELSAEVLTGVGPKKVEALASWGVSNVLELLTTYPRRYIDRSRQADLVDLAVGEQAVILAEVQKVSARRTRQGRSLVELQVHDGTGGAKVVFFNQAWRARQLAVGAQALFFGKLDTYRGARQMTNPVVDLLVGVDASALRTGRVVPVYPASGKAGLTSWELGGWIQEALRRSGRFADPLPEAWREELGLVDRDRALRSVHVPDTVEETRPARRRLAFDELFRLQLALVLRRRAFERDSRAIRHVVSPLTVTTSTPRAGGSADRAGAPTLMDDTLVGRFLLGLPFELTDAQRRALAVIFADLAGPFPMHRLLQGDVGSGKTVVALAALLAAVQGGHQGTLMVPTEVLAEQHFAAVRALTEGLEVPDPTRLSGRRPVSVALLTHRISGAERQRVRTNLSQGAIDVIVGTHALLTEDVTFASLGLVVIDEQHRFGVEQRAALHEKGRRADPSGAEDQVASALAHAAGEGADPDLLVMTATPIPRTAAMVVFGDLDMTVLDELPSGRTPVSTVLARTDLEANGAWERVRAEVAAGHRAFVVCPLVEGSDKVVAASAVEQHRHLADGELKGLTLGLLHGQMPASDKELVMAQFRTGAVQVLVATTVVEVGVDVPEATVMVIENAERFGIAQLHQLRGRVGRGSLPSWCYLLCEEADANGEAMARLVALEATTDGFELAETDLELRGEGTILGARQKGRSDLRLASLRRDRDLVVEARRVAEAITNEDPVLSDHEVLADEVRLFLDEEEAAFLFRS